MTSIPGPGRINIATPSKSAVEPIRVIAIRRAPRQLAVERESGLLNRLLARQ